MRPLLAAATLAIAPALARAELLPAPTPACMPAIAGAERSGAIPAGLLQAIAKIESGQRDPATGRLTPWPWTIDAEGQGHFYPDRASAIAAVRALQARGVRSIDVGCLQVNLMYHPDAFASLDQAFDPASNAAYAARFLAGLRAQTGSWPAAAAAYHSQTPGIGADYGRRVMALWTGGSAPSAAAHFTWLVPAALPSLPPARQAMVMRPALPARLLPMAAPGLALGGGALVGRGLDAYRRRPIRMVGRLIRGG